MDDLTQIHGVGPATAKRLAAAGIDSFEKLAAANPLDVPLSEIVRNSAEAQGWIEAAKAKIAKPDTEGSAQEQPGPDADATEDTADAAVAAASSAGASTAPASPGDNEPQGTHTTQSDVTGGAGDPASPSQATREDGLITIEVKGPKQGRWRAGIHFGPAPRTVEVTSDQLEMIEADSKLSIIAVQP